LGPPTRSRATSARTVAAHPVQPPVLVRTRGAVLRHGESGWGAVAIAAREVEGGADYDGAHSWGWGALVCGRPLTVRVGGILRMTEGFFGVCSWCGREQPEP
jgi:hypothetical protein